MKPSTTKIIFPEPTFGAASPVKVFSKKERQAVEADLIARGLLNPVKAKAPKLVTNFQHTKTNARPNTAKKSKTPKGKKGRPKKHG